jgi:hypothetical protein
MKRLMPIVASAMAIEVLIAKGMGLVDGVSWINGATPAGLVSCSAILIISAAMLFRHHSPWFYIPPVVLIAFCFIALWFHTCSASFYPVPEGSHGWYRPSSTTALMCYLLLSLSLFMNGDKWHMACIWGATVLSLLTIMGYVTESSPEKYNHLGVISMSLPSAVMVLTLCLGQILEIELCLFRSTRKQL